MPLSWALLGAAAVDDRLNCADAFAVSAGQDASPAQVREVADARGIRITRCQLGLFGRGPDAAEAPAAVVEAVGRWRCSGLPCAEAWQLAASLGVERLHVGAAADAAGVRITACQLGCF